MGFDVTYHPVTPGSIRQTYLEPRVLILNGMVDEVASMAAELGVRPFLTEGYIGLLDSSTGFGANDVFDKSHGFAAAACQGYFGTYFYIRGGAFSFVMARHPEYKDYTMPWSEVLPEIYTAEVWNEVRENYCSGAYIPCGKAAELAEIIRTDNSVREHFSEFMPGGNLDVFLKALDHACSNDTDLLEASDVILPNPADPYSSSGYTDLGNCDPEGMSLYIDSAADGLAGNWE